MKQILFAVLMCASICFSCTRERDMVVDVTNPIDSDRSGETVEVSWSEVQTALPEAAAGKLFVLNQAGDTLPLSGGNRRDGPASESDFSGFAVGQCHRKFPDLQQRRFSPVRTAGFRKVRPRAHG